MLVVVRVTHNKHAGQSIDVDYHAFNKNLTRGGRQYGCTPESWEDAERTEGDVWEGVKIIGDRIPQLSSVE
jgi:hypothetical protein